MLLQLSIPVPLYISLCFLTRIRCFKIAPIGFASGVAFVVLRGVVVSGFDSGVGNVLSRWVEVFICVGPDVPSLNGVNGVRVFVGK